MGRSNKSRQSFHRCFICIIAALHCSKDDAALLEKSARIADKAAVNRELRMLKGVRPEGKGRLRTV